MFKMLIWSCKSNHRVQKLSGRKEENIPLYSIQEEVLPAKIRNGFDENSSLKRTFHLR